MFQTESAGAERARAPSLTARAYEAIRHRILTCQMPPGLTFTEADLLAEMEMSKTPIREALLRLQVEGLVETIPRRGYVVSVLHVADIGEIFDVRAMVEGTCAEVAAQRATPDDLMRIDSLAQQSSAAYDRVVDPDLRLLQEQAVLNNAFHEAVAIATGNARLHRIAVQIIREYERFFFLEWRSELRYPPDHKDHAEIGRLISAGDAAGARAAMVAHVEGARAMLLAAVTETAT
ncbi:GntR family transcriptional regulator [Cereibacter sphaeroides]|uniref:GntR family transcriptional regulator n=1 Tax=Cereibacter sphaeroides TaxID=1063 RepID=UPI0039906952